MLYTRRSMENPKSPHGEIKNGLKIATKAMAWGYLGLITSLPVAIGLKLLNDNTGRNFTDEDLVKFSISLSGAAGTTKAIHTLYRGYFPVNKKV